MEDTSKITKKKKDELKKKQERQDRILNQLVKFITAAIALFGIIQFFVVAIGTLFGMKLGWLQYIASIVLMLLGVFMIKFGDWSTFDEQ